MGVVSLERKNLAVTLKADTEGSVQAVFATLNVIDKDGDVTVPGAFQPEPVNIAAWGHNWGDLPSGDGAIKEVGDEAIFEGAFYLGTPQGDATYQTLKQRFERGFTQEWSYGFSVEESDFGTFQGREVRFLKRLKVYEVSPVLVGAGEHTRTLDMKGFSNLSFDNHISEVRAAFDDLVERAKERVALRAAKEGRVLSAANRERLSSLLSALAQAQDEIKSLLDSTDPEKGLREAEQEYLRFVRQLAVIGR